MYQFILPAPSAQVTDAGLVHLKGLKNLRELRLYGSEVTEEGADDLRQALPNCRITRYIVLMR